MEAIYETFQSNKKRSLGKYLFVSNCICLDRSKIVKLMEWGYPEQYVVDSIRNLDPNYCTAGYYLLQMDFNHC
jgi:hypothetical protein